MKRSILTIFIMLIIIIQLLIFGCNCSRQTHDSSSRSTLATELTGTKIESIDITSRISEATISDITIVNTTSGGSTEVKPSFKTSTSNQSKSSSSISKSSAVQKKTATLLDDVIRKFGRVVPDKNGSAIIDWSSSGIEFVIDGTGAIVTMAGSTDNKTNQPYLSVFVDGNLRKTIAITKETKRYNVCSGLPKGKHTIQLIKVSEAVFSNIIISKIEVSGGEFMQPNKPKSRRLEFIGDSITSGWGMLVAGNVAFSTATEDSTRTWAALTAKECNADYNMFSISGHGIAVPGQSIPGKYKKANPCTNIMQEWDFSKFQPDAVVINLGTNDAANAVNINTFKNEVVKFLKLVRTKNPNAQIVWAYGVMINTYSDEIKSAINQYKSETGDQKVTYFEFARQEPPLGGQGHPSLETHKKMADAFVPELKKILGW